MFKKSTTSSASIGAILMNNHMSNFYDEMAELISKLKKEKILQWKLMLCVEVAAAELAEVLMQNNVEIDVESKTITWLMGVTSNSPKNKTPKGKGKAKGTRTSASTARGKNSIFGILVNKVQVEQSEAIGQQQQKRQPTLGPMSVCTPSGDVDGSTVNNSDNEFVGKHQGLPVKEANSKLKISV